jgi:protein-S-isoprenylcysteine O-methyltransferase
MDWVIPFQVVGLFLSVVFLHVCEYHIHRRYHPSSTALSNYFNAESGIVEYAIALSFGYVEYAIERLFFPFKSSAGSPLLWLGWVAMIAGIAIRLASLLTAGKSFNHFVQDRKKKGHVMVTWGVYRFARHPGYLGFYIFALGTQTMLHNPVALIGFAVVLWRFFDDRITYEEKKLLKFFPAYSDYRKRTPTWIPFIP